MRQSQIRQSQIQFQDLRTQLETLQGQVLELEDRKNVLEVKARDMDIQSKDGPLHCKSETKLELTGSDQAVSTNAVDGDMQHGATLLSCSREPEVETKAANTSSTTWPIQKPFTLIELENKNPTLANKLKDFTVQTTSAIIREVTNAENLEAASACLTNIQQCFLELEKSHYHHDHNVVRLTQSLQDTTANARTGSMHECGTQTQEHEEATVEHPLHEPIDKKDAFDAVDSTGAHSLQLIEYTTVQLEYYLRNSEHQVSEMLCSISDLSSYSDEFKLEVLSTMHACEVSHLRMRLPLLMAELLEHTKELETHALQLSGMQTPIKVLLDELSKGGSISGNSVRRNESL